MTLKPGAKPVELVVADANVILSAVTGKAALRVFTESDLKVSIAKPTLDEVREYVPDMARQYDVAQEVLQGQLTLLALEVYDPADCRATFQKAERLMKDRDPEDVDVVALALKLQAPIWSNDKDMDASGLDVYTTAWLLKVLGLGRK